MGTLVMLLAVTRVGVGEWWRTTARPYLRRYGYTRRWHARPVLGGRRYDVAAERGASHRARNVRRNLRETVGDTRVVKSARSIGYAARMSWIPAHSGEQRVSVVYGV